MVDCKTEALALGRVRGIRHHTPEHGGKADREQLESKISEQEGYLTDPGASTANRGAAADGIREAAGAAKSTTDVASRSRSCEAHHICGRRRSGQTPHSV